MLHHAQHDLVARLEARRRPGVADEVDPHRRAGGEDDLVLVARAEEALHRAAHRLVLLGRDARQVVQSAVHVGVFHRIGLGDRVDHRLRLLRRGAVVEIDQRPAVHLARQDRKVAAHRLDVVAHALPPGGEIPRIAAISVRPRTSADHGQHRHAEHHHRRLEAVQLGDEVGEGPEQPEQRRDREQSGQRRGQHQQRQLHDLDQQRHRVQPDHQRRRAPAARRFRRSARPTRTVRKAISAIIAELGRGPEQRRAQHRRRHRVDRGAAQPHRGVAEHHADAGDRDRGCASAPAGMSSASTPARGGARPHQTVDRRAAPHVRLRRAASRSDPRPTRGSPERRRGAGQRPRPKATPAKPSASAAATRRVAREPLGLGEARGAAATARTPAPRSPDIAEPGHRGGARRHLGQRAGQRQTPARSAPPSSAAQNSAARAPRKPPRPPNARAAEMQQRRQPVEQQRRDEEIAEEMRR